MKSKNKRTILDSIIDYTYLVCALFLILLLGILRATSRKKRSDYYEKE